MATIKITVPKVHCVKKNDLLNKDRVYLALIVTSAATLESKPKILFSGLSPVETFRKGNIKILNLGSAWQFDVNDNEVFNVSFGLYEYDKGDIYQQYQNTLLEIARTDGNMTYAQIFEEIWNSIKDKILSLNLVTVLTLLPELGIKLIKNLRKDDLLGAVSFAYKGNDPELEFVREYTLTDSESNYKIQLDLKIQK